MKLPPAPPPPPDQVTLDTHAIGRRWKEPHEVAERRLIQAQIPLLDIPQPPRKGVTLSTLLAFEDRWRKEQAERQIRWETERKETERRQAEARARLAQKQAEADRLVEEAATK
jgi:hypothetical protein